MESSQSNGFGIGAMFVQNDIMTKVEKITRNRQNNYKNLANSIIHTDKIHNG